MLKCDNCGRKGASVRKMSRFYQRGKKMLVIENVPVITCRDCGESYLTAKTVYELERLKNSRTRKAVKREAQVVEFVST